MLNFVPSAGQADPSNPMESGLCPRREVALPPTVRARARRPASRDPIGRSKNWIQKQSSPCIRKVQHAVLSVAGLKKTMSEFELIFLRQRSLEAIRQKARRGELQFRLPVGFRWAPNGKVEIDPDRRVQQAIHLVFAKTTEMGSARQVLLWFRREKTTLPALVVDEPGHEIIWKLPDY